MEALKCNYNKILSPKLAKNIIISLLFIIFFEFFLFPLPILAQEYSQSDNIFAQNLVLKSAGENNKSTLIEAVYEINLPTLPENDDLSLKKVVFTTFTAYNSEVAQTNSEPCITANGFNVCQHGIEDTIAANFLPFGTKVKIPDLFGDRIFIVRDRMNKRYPDRVDVWMLEKKDAINFGIKYSKLYILE
jgi:3D (Asp-Asp-Asp) domain-containing protein